MTDREMYEIYRRWILDQTDPFYKIDEKSEDEIDFVTESAVGHVQFYHLEYEICALTIETEKSDEPQKKTDYLGTTFKLTSQTIDFSKIKKDKINEYIELMREHQMDCVKNGNFIEAELAKQRVIQLKKIQDKKTFVEAKRKQKIVKKKFEENKQQEIKEKKKELDDKYAEEITKLEDLLSELKKRQEKELKDYFVEFEKNYPTEIKPSNELVEKQRQLDYYIKTEE